MSFGRILAAALTSAAVVGGALLVVGVSRAKSDAPARTSASPRSAADVRHVQHPVERAGARQAATVATTSSTAVTSIRPSVVAPSTPASTSTPTPTPTPSTVAPAPRHPTHTVVAAASTSAPTTPPPTPTTRAPATQAPATQAPATQAPATNVPATNAPAPQPRLRRGVALPLRMRTGRATHVITVVARRTWNTTARLQTWRKAPGGGWLRVGRATTAHIGSQGMTRSPSESTSATPIGSFTLTQAFGRRANPGTRLRYFKTTPADWWISQAGPLYNTHQRCSSNCPFTRGSPNEHLYYETPYYNYAVVIDYNTRNTGHVRQGAGSAFFLHVTDGRPTAGCVSIGQAKLKGIMRWLTPRTHPRILIGTA